ncbi:hypothetical protein C8Q76DRAFT_689627 [Earliella scabrosa]|nr:hypothetical protein C8Q76DRAFT_689627 [Earliella scabrosa]
MTLTTTDEGVLFYRRWKEPELPGYSLTRLGQQNETRAEVVEQYLSKAELLHSIQEIFKFHVPGDPLTFDVKDLPVLLRECLQAEEENMELGNDINEGNDRIDGLKVLAGLA